MMATEGNGATYLTFWNDDDIEIYLHNPNTARNNHF